MSSFTTPFCSESTAVWGPTAGFIARAAASLSQSLTEISTRSATPRRGVRGRVDARNVDVALRRVLDREAAFAHRREVRAARDEDDVVAGAGEPAAEEAADAARAHHQNLHGSDTTSGMGHGLRAAGRDLGAHDPKLEARSAQLWRPAPKLKRRLKKI